METDKPENITKKCVDFNTDIDEGRDKRSLLKSLYRILPSHHPTSPIGGAQLQWQQNWCHISGLGRAPSLILGLQCPESLWYPTTILGQSWSRQL